MKKNLNGILKQSRIWALVFLCDLFLGGKSTPNDVKTDKPKEPATEKVKDTTNLTNAPVLNLYGSANSATDSVSGQPDQKAQAVCAEFVKGFVEGLRNINSAEPNNHAEAVKRELPGAIPGNYCLFAINCQLNRVLANMGINETIIPDGGKHSCSQFCKLMDQMYSSNPNAIRHGKLYLDSAAYDKALQAVLEQTPSNLQDSVVQQFEKNNINIADLNPATIIIVSSKDSPSGLHATIHLGIGKIINGEFVPDSCGKHIYAWYNNERIGDLNSFYLGNVFVVNLFDIIRKNEESKRKVSEFVYQHSHPIFLRPNAGNTYRLTPEDLKLMGQQNSK